MACNLGIAHRPLKAPKECIWFDVGTEIRSWSSGRSGCVESIWLRHCTMPNSIPAVLSRPHHVRWGTMESQDQMRIVASPRLARTLPFCTLDLAKGAWCDLKVKGITQTPIAYGKKSSRLQFLGCLVLVWPCEVLRGLQCNYSKHYLFMFCLCFVFLVAVCFLFLKHILNTYL